MYITLKNDVDIRKKLIEPANATLVCLAYALTILCNRKKTRPNLKIRSWMYIRRNIMYEKAAFCHIFGVRKSNSVACRFSSINVHYSVYRLNEVYVVVFFSIKYRYFIGCCNRFVYRSRTCYCIDMVSVTSASRNVTSASRYQSRPSVYIDCLIQRNWPRQIRIDEG